MSDTRSLLKERMLGPNPSRTLKGLLVHLRRTSLNLLDDQILKGHPHVRFSYGEECVRKKYL